VPILFGFGGADLVRGKPQPIPNRVDFG
jgi:hypothetical protein